MGIEERIRKSKKLFTRKELEAFGKFCQNSERERIIEIIQGVTGCPDKNCIICRNYISLIKLIKAKNDKSNT